MAVITMALLRIRREIAVTGCILAEACRGELTRVVTLLSDPCPSFVLVSHLPSIPTHKKLECMFKVVDFCTDEVDQ